MRLMRLVLLTVMTFLALSLIIAIARPETGVLEKFVMTVGVLGLFLGALPIQRMGDRGAR